MIARIGRAAIPNAFQPARPCTLLLSSPGLRLVGPGLVVTSYTPAIPDANGDFLQLPFGPDDFAFDQVNVFWHAQSFLERLRGHGLDLHEYPVRVIVQQGIGSGTMATEPISTIGTGQDGRLADAKDGDIIVHELTHAVFNPRMPRDAHPLDKGESGAVAEGLADYFAAAVHGNTRIGEYSSPPNGFYDVATDPAVYRYSRWDALPSDPYSRGKILNGALLEFRARVGEVADALVFQALAYRPLRCMPCFADAMRSADLDLHGGAHLAALDAAFAQRDITGLPPTVLALLGRSELIPGERAIYRLSHACGVAPVRTRWELSHDGGETWVPQAEEADSLEIVAERPFLLRASVRDRYERESEQRLISVTVWDPNDPLTGFGRIRLRGPQGLENGQSAQLTFEFEGPRGIPPLRFAWTVFGATFAVPRNDTTRTIIAQRNASVVTVTCTDQRGRTSSDTLRIAWIQALRTGVQGPAEVSPGQAARFSAAPVDGLAPYEHQWRQRFWDQTEVSLAGGSEAESHPSVQSFDMILTTTDARGIQVVASTQVLVLPTVVVLEHDDPRRFRVLGSLARRGEKITFELPDGFREGELEILDVAGRVCGRVSPLPEKTPRVEFRLPVGWEAGLYFARLSGFSPSPAARFIVLP